MRARIKPDVIAKMHEMRSEKSPLWWIAEQLGVGSASVHYHTSRPYVRKELEVSDEELARLYLAEHLSIRTLARKFRVHDDTIRRRLGKQGVEIRTKSSYVRDWQKVHTIPKVWCAQCERQVSLPEGTNCKSQWCKA